MLEAKISYRLTCVTNSNEPANVVCFIDSRTFSHSRYYAFLNNSVPLRSTPVKVFSLFDKCRKKRSNCLKGSIRGFSSDSSSENRFVTSQTSKECF